MPSNRLPRQSRRSRRPPRAISAPRAFRTRYAALLTRPAPSRRADMKMRLGCTDGLALRALAAPSVSGPAAAAPAAAVAAPAAPAAAAPVAPVALPQRAPAAAAAPPRWPARRHALRRQPTYNGTRRSPASGTGIHANPPLQWENLDLQRHAPLLAHEGEVWGVTDLSAASPSKRWCRPQRPDHVRLHRRRLTRPRASPRCAA